jgi:hypothetical protein
MPTEVERLARRLTTSPGGVVMALRPFRGTPTWRVAAPPPPAGNQVPEAIECDTEEDAVALADALRAAQPQTFVYYLEVELSA